MERLTSQHPSPLQPVILLYSSCSVFFGVIFAIVYGIRRFRLRARLETSFGTVPDLCLKNLWLLFFFRALCHTIFYALTLSGVENLTLTKLDLAFGIVNRAITYCVTVFLTATCTYRYIFNCNRSLELRIDQFRTNADEHLSIVFIICPEFHLLLKKRFETVLLVSAFFVPTSIGILLELCLCRQGFGFSELQSQSVVLKVINTLLELLFILPFFLFQVWATYQCFKLSRKRKLRVKAAHFARSQSATPVPWNVSRSAIPRRGLDPSHRNYKVRRLNAEILQSLRLFIFSLITFINVIASQIFEVYLVNFRMTYSFMDVSGSLIYFFLYLFDFKNSITHFCLCTICRLCRTPRHAVQAQQTFVDPKKLCPSPKFAFADADRRSSVAFPHVSTTNVSNFDPDRPAIDIGKVGEKAGFEQTLSRQQNLLDVPGTHQTGTSTPDVSLSTDSSDLADTPGTSKEETFEEKRKRLTAKEGFHPSYIPSDSEGEDEDD